MTVVNTALGPIPIDELGPTLAHEHLFINMMAERRGDGLVHDESLMIDELRKFADQGGRTIFDLTTSELTPGTSLYSDPSFTATSPGQTRDPGNIRAVQAVSRATNVNVVLGTGRYRDPYLSSELIDRLQISGLVGEMVRDIREGFPGTDAKAGIIGEIGADKWFISALEERVFRAAARAHLETGVPVYTHAARWPVGIDQVGILQEEGMAPERIAVGHADTVPDPDYAKRIADLGTYVGFDTINNSAPRFVGWRVEGIVRLVQAGFLRRILLAHDVCTGSQLTIGGGNGFGFILGGFRERLIEAGITEEQFDEITVKNPARFLSGDDS